VAGKAEAVFGTQYRQTMRLLVSDFVFHTGILSFRCFDRIDNPKEEFGALVLGFGLGRKPITRPKLRSLG
jgi:hypothetical protein